MVRKVDDDLYLPEGDEEFEDYNEHDSPEIKKNKSLKKSDGVEEYGEEKIYQGDEVEEEEY